MVLMMELAEEDTDVSHLKHKITLVLSTECFFAEELRPDGSAVNNAQLDASDNIQEPFCRMENFSSIFTLLDSPR